MKKWDVCIVGGGLAGLASACFLARSGMEVLLLEKSDRLGGRAATDEQADCFFNLGPHALYKKGAAVKVLYELGIFPRGGSPGLSGLLIHEGKRHDFPFTPVSLLKTNALTWPEKKEWVRMLYRLLRLEIEPLFDISLQEWADQQIREERVKQLFFAFCRLTSYSDDPARASAGALIRQFRLSAAGVLYLHHGWQTIVDDLKAQALRAGAAIQCHKRVVEIGGATPDMKVTLADGSTVLTRHVLSTAGPAATCKMIKNAEHTRLAKWKETLVPVKGACLDVALKRLPDPSVSFAIHLEEPLYFSDHTRAARLSRNPEHSVIHVFKYRRSHDEQNPTADKRELESFLDLLQPGWEKEVITSRFLPDMTVSYGLADVKRGAVLFQESPVLEEIPGLYVAGDWMVQDGLLADASLSSAKATAMSILQAERMRRVSV